VQYLLSQLAELNIKLKVMDEQLHVSAPVGAMTKELAALLREHKPALIDMINDGNAAAKYEPLPILTPDPDARYDAFPLTAIQHAYWMGRSQKKIELGGVSTHFYFELDASGLDVALFEKTFNDLIIRHDMLRTVIDKSGMQQVLPKIAPYTILINDVRLAGDQVKTATIDEMRTKMSHQVLSTNKAPIMEVRVTQLTEESTRIHISLDMLILDSLSMMILFREWNVLYKDSNAVLPNISITYRDYVLAEEKLTETNSYKHAKEYWWNLIDELPAAPQMPQSSVSMIGEPPKFTRRRFKMPATQWKALQVKAKEIGVTSTGIVLAAFTEILTRWSNSPHYTLNVTLFNRQALHSDVNKLLGDFTSLMLLEVDHRNRGSFVERTQKTQTRFMHDLEHRAVSGLEVMREIRQRSHASLEASMPIVFTSGLVFSGKSDAGLLESFGPMVYGVSQTPQVSLDHQVMEVNGDLICNWDSVDGKFHDGMVETLYDTFCELMTGLATDNALWQQRSVIGLPLAQAQLRQKYNDTKTAELSTHLLQSDFIKQAVKQPDVTAIITHDGLHISYGNMLAMANKLAKKLVEKGVKPEQCVAVVMDKSWEQVVTVFAILMAGGAYLPISASLPEKRRTLLLEQGGASIAVTQAGLVEKLTWTESVSCIVVEFEELAYLSAASEAVSADNAQPHDLAYVIFTSGTTGMPKGVMIEHEGAVNTVEHLSKMLNVTRDDTVFAISALNFDLSVYDIFGVLGAGGCMVIPDATRLSDPLHWLNLMKEHGVTLWNSAPASMEMLVDYAENESSHELLDSLKMVWMSGDRISVPLPDRIRTCFRNTKVYSFGGATEASIWSIYYPIENVDLAWGSIPYGKPLVNQTIYVLNDAFEDCPTDVVGGIYIGGDGLARGYLGDEEKTNERFITNYKTGERLYDTGDLGRYIDGNDVEILGRSDFQVKIRGYRIELGEIASALTQHKEIKQAVAMPATLADGQKQIVTYVVLQDEFVELGQGSAKEVCYGLDALQSTITSSITDVSISQFDSGKENSLTALNYSYLHLAQVVFLGLKRGKNIGERFTFSDLITDGVQAAFIPWCRRAIAYLELHDFVSVNHDSILVKHAFTTMSIDMMTDNLSTALASIGYTPEQSTWVVRNSQDILDVITGAVSIEDAYDNGDDISSFFKMFWSEAHSHVAAIIKDIASHITEYQGGDELVVLEVGAGFGVLTESIAEVLGHNTRYTVTDTSEENLEYLYEKYVEEYDVLEFGLFDLNESPEDQGLLSQHYDVVLASSVMSKVENVAVSLSNLQGLLRPGGLLILVEATKYNASFDLHMGLLQDFNQSPHGLLSLEQWQAALQQANFTDIATTNTVNSFNDELGLSVIIAQAANNSTLDVNAVKNYLSDLLPDYMVPQHIVQLDSMPVSSNGKLDYKKLPSIEEIGLLGQAQVLAPRNQVESDILAVWTNVLSVSDISVDSDFFNIGGNSILAAQIVRETNMLLPDFNLEIFEFFEHLTIIALAELYQERKGETS